MARLANTLKRKGTLALALAMVFCLLLLTGCSDNPVAPLVPDTPDTPNNDTKDFPDPLKSESPGNTQPASPEGGQVAGK